jgi:hypothetical protein
MADFLQFASILKEQMNAALSRSDILRPLTWLVGLFLFATIGLVASAAPQWMLIGAGSVLGATVLLYLGAYIYCLICNPDALRSERYSIQKMAIEHGLLGDSDAGQFTRKEAGFDRSPDSMTKQIEHKS